MIRYGTQVENYLEVYLRTPNLPKADVMRALLARANARKMGGEKLLARAQQGMSLRFWTRGVKYSRPDFQAALKLDPANREIQQHLRRDKQVYNLSSLHITPLKQKFPGRSTSCMSLPPSARPPKYGNELRFTSHGTICAHGYSSRPFTGTSPYARFSTH